MGKREELLLLTALSGELPADWVGFAVGSDSYAAILITKMKAEGALKLRSRDGIRGYLLRAKAKRTLWECYPEDVRDFLSGSSCTNHVKSEPEKRMRLHRMSMVWIFCRYAGIEIFPSRKPCLFSSEGRDTRGTGMTTGESAFYYGTAEWKQETDQEIKSSRACGLLLADRAYIIYNTLDSLMKWRVKTERNLRARMELRIRRGLGIQLEGAVIMGTGSDMVKRMLTSNGGIKGDLFIPDDVYEQYYYVPLIREASIQIRLLCAKESEARLRIFLDTMLVPKRESKEWLEDGQDREGRPVYFCYLLEIKKLQRILSHPFVKPGRIVCFTYQARELKEIFPESFSIEAIQPEKAARYLGWKM